MLTSDASDDRVAKVNARASQSSDRRLEIVDLNGETIPPSGFRPGSIRHGPTASTLRIWRAEHEAQLAAREHCKRRCRVHVQMEAEMRGIERNRGIDIVLLANLLTNALKFGNSGHSKVLGAPTDVLERLTVDPDQGLKTLIQDIKAAQEKATEFLRVLGGAA